ncbi:N-acetylmuramoyl-L-alanine amidase family protein [Paenisporosarcina sp. NPDC076898]|uniref:N-acetylmuramoyl-L-alanine amidase family protein n=1 Tax=unclassified Paenisporosarcina TaxID=2642018 RepID=UPI003D082322
MKKVTWSAGHGLLTPGKQTPDGQKEWTFNDKVVRAGMSFLAQYEDVAQLRLDDPTGLRDIPLQERSNQANAWGTNLHVDVHHNALGFNWVPFGLGIETFAMKGTQNYEQSLKLANIVQPLIVKAMGLKDRGVKSANLHMLREIKAPAILTEGGFMDSQVDVAVMRNDVKLKAQGEAIAQGIAQYLGLKMKVDELVENEIKLTVNQQKDKDVLVRRGYMANDYKVMSGEMVALITIIAALIRDLEENDALK